MLEKTNTEKTLELFFTYPTKRFHIREIARMVKISPPTVLSALKRLKEAELVHIEKGKAVNLVVPNAETGMFIRKKRIYNISIIYESGFADYLNEIYDHPQAIILFGSFSRGDDIEKSDVDIAVVTKKHAAPDVRKFEETIKRGINVHEIDFDKISEEFRNNLLNGIVLEGSVS